jgi:hypothetical protein
VASGKGADDRHDLVPEAFARALTAVRAAWMRPEVVVEETPAPQRLAPYSVALSAEVVVGDVEVAGGRLVLLHEPDGHEAWQGTFRLVAYVRAELDQEMAGDPLLPSVGWAWLTEALDAHGAGYLAPSGTVTRVSSESFGAMSDESASAQVEIRASWTPLDGTDVGSHVSAWADVLCAAAGLPPLPAGVRALPGRRPRSR